MAKTRIPRRKIVVEPGRRFGKLTVIRELETLNRRHRIEVMCDCGATKIVLRWSVYGGVIKSCGNCERQRHGHSKSPEARSWYAMHRRCKIVPSYAGRGIGVCERWGEFANFYADMGPKPSLRHTIDRINNDGNYCPENCRWATPKEQMRNTRKTKRIKYRGETVSMLDVAEQNGLTGALAWSRIHAGWDVIRAVEEKPH